MNRRELLRAVPALVVAPSLAITTVAPSKMKRTPDWDKVVTDWGYARFLHSIKVILSECLKQPVRLERAEDGSAGFFAGSIHLLGIAAMVDGVSEYDHVWFKEWANKEKARKNLIRLVEVRWIDCLWNMNDEINDRLALLEVVGPCYKLEVM